ncbi:MAG: hypothetical protein EAY81_09490 [Bacteroidetes bacterium]|nr:MAG: hypothetical protein EAY81_09490 [Bacteroidota bacterium]
MKTSFYLLIVAIILSGCTATHFGTFTGSSVMIPAEHRYAGSVSGAASASYFLGEGGLFAQGLAAEARANMLSKFPARDGLILANFTTDIKTSYILCFTKRTLMLTADVIDIKQTTLPYGLKNGYFLNDTVFFELPTLKELIVKKRINKERIKPDDYLINFDESWMIGDSIPVLFINDKMIGGSIVKLHDQYGVLCKTNIEGKTIYVRKHPRSIAFRLNNP